MTPAGLASSEKSCLASSDLRSKVTERLLRFMFRKPMLSGPFILNPMAPRVWSPVGGSTLMTSAPISARSMQANGPAMTWLTSKTRMPFRGRLFPVVILAIRANVGGTYDLAPFFVLYCHKRCEVIDRAAAVFDAVAVEALGDVGHEQSFVDVCKNGRAHV